MSALNALQLAFQQYVLQGMSEVHDSVASANPDERLRIYHDAYRLRLIEALASGYQALRAYMGLTAFNVACRAYIEHAPSLLRNVRWYGAHLPRFLQEMHPFSEQPLLSEIASFEWALTTSFDAAEQSTVSFEDLTIICAEDWPRLSFTLHPCVDLLALRTNAPAFRKAFDAGDPLPSAILAERPTSWLIWRNRYTVCFRSLSAAEEWALRAVRGKADFTALCEGLCEWIAPDEAAPHAAGLVRGWVDDGLIVQALRGG